jgi:predicted Zn-dependent protease
MTWRDRFDRLGDHVALGCPPGEGFALWLQAEDSDFVRFNHGLVRQPGSVSQASVSIRWFHGRRHASADVTLTGDEAADQGRVDDAIDGLRAALARLPDDPHLLRPDAPLALDRVEPGSPPDGRAATEAILDAARAHGLDLVGILAAGSLHRGYRDDQGGRGWLTSHGHVFDFCLVHDKDKAVKRTFAGKTWDDDAFRAEVDAARADLAVLARPSRRLDPGRYRSFLTPTALLELVDLLGQDAFSARAQRQKRSPLQRLVAGERALHPSVHLAEHPAGGLAPAFQPTGFARPDRVVLVDGGRHAAALVSPRTAVEHGLQTNGADESESPTSLDMAGGDLPLADARRRLGTGLWISNLWYANHSDRNAARMTGMTRFATLWVEDGEPVAPVDVLRFDDSAYDLLGDRLEAITAETSFLPSTSTYFWRSTQSARLPGILVDGMTFTL